MTAPASAPIGDQQFHPRWIRVVLIVVTLFDTVAGLVDLPNIFQGDGQDTALLKVTQAATGIRTAVTPVISAVALYFAIVGRIRHAIIAMGVLILVWWLSDLLQHDFIWLIRALHLFIYPLLAVAAIVLAVKARMLGLATLFVCVPDIVAWLGVLALAFGVLVNDS